jgi:hypothetical protein
MPEPHSKYRNLMPNRPEILEKYVSLAVAKKFRSHAAGAWLRMGD